MNAETPIKHIVLIVREIAPTIIHGLHVQLIHLHPFFAPGKRLTQTRNMKSILTITPLSNYRNFRNSV